ncbi:MAG: hypothetical protein KDB80_06815 [Planctomycetes bacterium]|nr:hypothetical protein [Planctomycetota bacterium]
MAEVVGLGLSSRASAMVREFVQKHRWYLLAGVVLLALTLVSDPFPSPSHAEILDAIRMVESGGRDDCPDGDGGKAIGPFQIHENYWRDAVAFDPSIGPGNGFSYQDCRDRDYAMRVVDAYMTRWIPDAWAAADAETIARTHNGGPRGAEKSSTEGYWQRVRKRLD